VRSDRGRDRLPAHPGLDVVEHGLKQGLLAREVVIERPAADTGLVQHRLDRGVLVPARREQAGGGGGQPGAGPLPAGDVPVRSLHHGSRSPLMSGLTYRLSVCFYRPTVSLLRLQPSTGKASTMQLAELDAHRRAVQTRSGEISYIDTGTGPVALF